MALLGGFRVSPIFRSGLYESSIATHLTQGFRYLLRSLGDFDQLSARCCISSFSSDRIRKDFVHRSAVSSTYTIQAKQMSVPIVGLHVVYVWANRLTGMSPPTPLTRLGNFAIPALGAIGVMDAQIVTKSRGSDSGVATIDCLGLSHQRANEALQNMQE